MSSRSCADSSLTKQPRRGSSRTSPSVASTLRGLAQRRAGNAHFAGQPKLVDPFAVAQGAHADHVAQAIRDFRYKACRTMGSGHGARSGLTL